MSSTNLTYQPYHLYIAGQTGNGQGPQFSAECRILSWAAEFARFRGISIFLRNFVDFSTGRG